MDLWRTWQENSTLHHLELIQFKRYGIDSTKQELWKSIVIIVKRHHNLSARIDDGNCTSPYNFRWRYDYSSSVKGINFLKIKET